MARRISHVLFDLDGTLADTAPDLAHALNQTLGQYGRPPLAFASIRPLVSQGAVKMLEHAFVMRESAPEFAEIRQRFLTVYGDTVANETSLFDGMDTVLATLEDNDLGWGVVTNKPAWLTEPLMQALALVERAGCIISGDTLAERKPHPAPMYLACARLRTKPNRTVFVGDAGRDIEAGRRAGMKTLAAAYGYIDADDDVAGWGADGIIDSPMGLLHWLDLDA